jgi:hypothetical protein
MKRHAFVIFAVLALTAAIPMGQLPALARTVQVSPLDETSPSGLADKQELLQRGFRQAVFQEALDILPAPLDEERRQLLLEHLKPLADRFVRSYSERGLGAAPTTPDQEPRPVAVEVDVNASLLERHLRRTGIYYTASGLQPFNFVPGDLPPGAWNELGRLQTLTGLHVRAVEMPRLVLEHGENVWTGLLETEEHVYQAEHPELEQVWFQLWGDFFSRPELEQAGAHAVDLRVSGWYTPDGVYAFDRLLREWKTDLQGLELRSLRMDTSGIVARWRVRLRDEQDLQTRLETYLPSRGLTWELSPAES